jgi:hypothetical protein
MMRGSDGKTVIDRTFRLLRAFHADTTELTLDELANRSGLARTTVLDTNERARASRGRIVTGRRDAGRQDQPHPPALGGVELEDGTDVIVDFICEIAAEAVAMVECS